MDRCGNAGGFLPRRAFGYLLHLVGGGAASGHGGRQQAAGVAFVVQVVDELSIFRFLCKQLHQQTNQSVTEQPKKNTYWVSTLHGLSPDSASLSDSLSSSELELLEALAWPGAAVWTASSSSSSVGPQGNGGCLSRSCR